jgi:hypothetical protein
MHRLASDRTSSAYRSPSLVRLPGRYQALGRPVLDRALHRLLAGLWCVQLAEISQPTILRPADSLDHAGIPKGVHVRAFVEESDLGLVAALVVVVADVAGSVQILDAVDQEPQSEPPILDRLALVPERQPELVDLSTTQPLLEVSPENLAS